MHTDERTCWLAVLLSKWTDDVFLQVTLSCAQVENEQQRELMTDGRHARKNCTIANIMHAQYARTTVKRSSTLIIFPECSYAANFAVHSPLVETCSKNLRLADTVFWKCRVIKWNAQYGHVSRFFLVIHCARQPTD